ncbi:permease [Mycolicibacterium goodii]|uniref:Permease n=1 Tax=Mycolicibacterium goodii TaxID=134601 RepID=A0A0K0X169_MYCGD|nr:hypothetical protein AFA91_03900 [Mycolicibacterium goodii]
MQLTAAHWVYLLGIASLFVAMAARRSVVVPAVVATILTTWVYTGSLVHGISSAFSASAVAITELLSIFLVLATVTAMLGAMKAVGAEQRMINPLARLMKNAPVSFAVLFVATYLLSLVFWPTPSLALIAAILLPAAIRAGLSPLAAAMAIAIAGQGMALASDFVIGVAPSLSATGAGVPADLIANRAMVLSWVVGAVAVSAAYALYVRTGRAQRRLLPTGVRRVDHAAVSASGTSGLLSDATPAVPADPDHHRTDGIDTYLDASASDHPAAESKSRMFAILVPVAFASAVVFMLLGKFTTWVPAVTSGNGAALVGGLALVLTVLITLLTGGGDRLERTGAHFVDGLVFAFRAMGVVVPVAGFVLIGISDFAGRIMLLPEDSTPPAFLFDLIGSAQPYIPDNRLLIMFSMAIAGMLIGLDGSGWTGLPFTGGLAHALSGSAGPEATATLAAIAQNAAGWTGGGTLIIWSSLVAVAGVAGVPVATLARRLFIPVVIGLILSVFVAALIW